MLIESNHYEHIQVSLEGISKTLERIERNLDTKLGSIDNSIVFIKAKMEAK